MGNPFAYFVDVSNPNQEAEMAAARDWMFAESREGWKTVIDRVSTALKGTRWTHVTVDMTGGGVFTLFALSNPDDPETDYLVAGPFAHLPDLELDWQEATVAYQPRWDDNEYRFGFLPIHDRASTDVEDYASHLADSVRVMADAVLDFERMERESE